MRSVLSPRDRVPQFYQGAREVSWESCVECCLALTKTTVALRDKCSLRIAAGPLVTNNGCDLMFVRYGNRSLNDRSVLHGLLAEGFQVSALESDDRFRSSNRGRDCFHRTEGRLLNDTEFERVLALLMSTILPSRVRGRKGGPNLRRGEVRVRCTNLLRASQAVARQLGTHPLSFLEEWFGFLRSRYPESQIQRARGMDCLLRDLLRAAPFRTDPAVILDSFSWAPIFRGWAAPMRDINLQDSIVLNYLVETYSRLSDPLYSPDFISWTATPNDPPAAASIALPSISTQSIFTHKLGSSNPSIACPPLNDLLPRRSATNGVEQEQQEEEHSTSHNTSCLGLHKEAQHQLLPLFSEQRKAS